MSVIDSCVGEVRMAPVTIAANGDMTAGEFQLVGEQVSWEVNENADIKKRKTLGKCSPSVSVGSTDWDIKLKGYLDLSDGGQQLIQNGKWAAIRVNPTEDSNKYYEGFGIVGNVKRDGDADGDYVNMAYEVAGDGELTKQGVV